MTLVRVRDISPRLAFQAQQTSTALKVELVDRLTASGIRAIEVSSFVNRDLVPGLSDAEVVFSKIRRTPGVSFECCVASSGGLRRAIDAGADIAWFLLATDDAFSRLNTGRSVAEALDELAQMANIAAVGGIRLGSYLIGAFGGPKGPPKEILHLEPITTRLASLGILDWILADSWGYASPAQIREALRTVAPSQKGRLTIQVHDTRGLGLANIVAMLEGGITNLDTSLAGSGAHPAMPGAYVGGTCTEDAVQMLHLMNVATGIDLQALIDTANWLQPLLEEPGKGFVRHSGPVPVDRASLKSSSSSTDCYSFDWGPGTPGKTDEHA